MNSRSGQNYRSSVKRYYYDELLGKCLPFFYGNCMGNESGFDSINDCIDNCTAHSNHKVFFECKINLIFKILKF